MSTLYRALFDPPRRGVFVLLDPDRDHHLREIAGILARPRMRDVVRGVLVGTSFLERPDYGEWVRSVRSMLKDYPLLLFPGGSYQLVPDVDAVLYLSLLSGRNPRYLVEEQVKAAPWVRSMGLEAIPTAYLLVGEGVDTSVSFITGTRPIPSSKPELVCAHAMAAEILGFRLLYLEAGSGAGEPVPDTVIQAVRRSVALPMLVGGGIRTVEEVECAFRAGADGVVLGTVLEQSPEFLEELEGHFAHHTEGN